MPFTPSHVAAVLPVLGLRSDRVVPAAWVVGAMSPDLVYYVAAEDARSFSHSPGGLLTVDLVLGSVVLAVWWGLLAAPSRDLLPDVVRRRVPVPTRPWPRFGWVLLGLLAGSVTHVVWDAFTHRDGWGLAAAPGLRDAVWGGQPAYSVLQDVSGVLGLGLVGLWLLVRVRDGEPVATDDPVLRPGERRLALVVLVLAPVALGVAITAAIVPGYTYPVDAVVAAFTRTVAVCGAGAVVAALGWHRLRRRRSGPPSLAG